MLKKFIKSFFWAGLLLSTLHLGAEVEVTSLLQDADLAVLDQHETVVILTPEVIKALEEVPAALDSTLSELQGALQQGLKVAPYSKALSAVDQAIQFFADVSNPSCQALNEYKILLLAGDVTIVAKDAMPDRSNKRSKRFCRISVQNLNASCANLCNVTAGTISGASTSSTNAACVPCNPNNVLLIRSGADVCGNLQFNSSAGTTPATGLLNAQGAWESGLQILRGVVGFSGIGGLTLALNSLGTPVINNAFNVTGFIGTVTPTLLSGASGQFIFNTALNDVIANTNLAAFSVEGILAFKIHVDFGVAFTAIPTIELTPSISDINSLTNITTIGNRTGSVTLSKFSLEARNVTNTGFDLVIVVFPESHEFLTQAEINAAIGGVGANLLINFFNALSINLLVDGKITN